MHPTQNMSEQSTASPPPKKTVKPLWLPLGSIRALTILSLSSAFWILAWTDRYIPEYMLTSLSAVMAYYFAYRKKTGNDAHGPHEQGNTQKTPLFLPAGLIRMILILGFFASLVALYRHQQLFDQKFIEFFSVLLGFMAGYLFDKCIRLTTNSFFYNLSKHLNALLVLCLAFGLTAGLLLNHPFVYDHEGYFTAFIGFYFGSRS